MSVTDIATQKNAKDLSAAAVAKVLGLTSGNKMVAVAGANPFTFFPRVHSASGETTPIYGRTSTDALTVGAWNIVHDGVEGDIFHFTTGENSVDNANGAVIAIGIDYGGTGIVLRNKKQGIGLNIDQLNTVDSATAYAFVATQRSNVAPHTRKFLEATATKPVEVWDVHASVAAGTPHVQWNDQGVGGSFLAGQILSDVGTLDWRRSIEVRAPNSSGTPLIRVRDEASTPSEAYLGGKTNGELGLRVYRYSGSTTTAYAFGWLAESDRFKLKAGQGPANKGSETFSTMIEVRCIAGTGNLGQMGFFGATPVNRQTLPSAMSTGGSETNANLATAINQLRSILSNLGLAA